MASRYACGSKSGGIVKLMKTVHDLKQDGRQWSLRLLTEELIANVWVGQCKTDSCVFD